MTTTKDVVSASENALNDERDMTHAYADDLRADIYTDVNADPKALVHSSEWRKIMNGACARVNVCIQTSVSVLSCDVRCVTRRGNGWTDRLTGGGRVSRIRRRVRDRRSSGNQPVSGIGDENYDCG